MPQPFAARLTDVLELPDQLESLSTPLGKIFDRIGLTDFTIDLTSIGLPPGDTAAVPPVSEEDALAYLEWYEGEETITPPAIDVPQAISPTTLLGSGSRSLRLQLQALSDVVIQLAGLEAISFVLNPGGFEVLTTIHEGLVSVAFTVGLAVRFSQDLLRPMRKVTSSNGQVTFEADPTRPFVQIDIGQVSVIADSEGTIDFNTHVGIDLDEPVMIVAAGMVIESAQLVLNLSGDRKFLAFRWRETNLSQHLSKLAPNFSQQGVQGTDEITLRIVFGDPIEEIRLDWESDHERTFALPGLKATTPENSRFSVLLSPTEDSTAPNQFTLILTAEAEKTLRAASNFAWERGDDRELHNDDEQPGAELFAFAVDTQQDVSLVLLSFRLDELKLPTFFKQLAEPLIALDFSDPEALGQASHLGNFTSLKKTDWREPTFSLNLDKFDLPFLKQKGGDNSQFIQLRKPNPLVIKVVSDQTDTYFNALELPLDVQIKIGSLEFLTEIGVQFNWETFAISVDHDLGIEMVSEQPQLPATDAEYLGLKWRFKGKEITIDGKKKYHYFTLATKDYNYQLQQADGAVFEVDFIRASDEPITFSISDFALSPKGINLTAEVTDRPAKLNGIDTRFRFHGSRFEIKENRIADFTLAGSGPLPPALVGDAIVDIALQFSQRNGNLTLVAGSAKLKGSKLLDCRASRFQFQVDAIGLQFVNDGRFHLYFTLTGSAQFVLAKGDDKEGALALLPKIKIDMVDCPLTGDTKVLAKHIKFLIELPKPLSFNFLGCFEFELRAFGFIPQAKEFDGDGAMQITGQLKFAQGAGDTPNSDPQLHSLLIGLPKPGGFFPRIHFLDLSVNLNFGEAFKLSGSVSFKDSLTEKGFDGEGILEIQGLPTIAASFGFFRVRRDESSPWVRAWFIYLEVRQVSFQIPVVQLFLREVGLGFGYRYTLVSIKAADRANDVRQLLKELTALSRTQGDLSKRDRWAIDLEAAGEDPRWTIVLRALISQTSASPSPLRWNEAAEREIPCVFLFDAVIAFRSDLTFFMAARAWLNTNYYNYVTDDQGLRAKPLFSGFVLLSPRQKRFLAHVASNPEGHLGSRPPLPDIIQKAIRGGQFSATLLIEPGLFHYEMGWPNMLRWGTKLGPLEAEIRGGFIFRISKRELVIGSSYLARASLDIKAEISAGIVGCRVIAFARIAYGARFIAVVSFEDVTGNSAVYGAIGLEAQIRFSIEFWIRLKIGFIKISKTFRFSLSIGFTAGLEIGLMGTDPGLRGTGTVSVSFMGHSLQLSVKLGANESAVTKALDRTKPYLQLGLQLEATDVEGVPGTGQSLQSAPQAAFIAPSMAMSQFAAVRNLTLDSAPAEVDRFKTPHYTVFVIRKPGDWSYLVLLPQGEAEDTARTSHEPGFLPAPPTDAVQQDAAYTSDFSIELPALNDRFELWHFNPITTGDPWGRVQATSVSWKANWNAAIQHPEDVTRLGTDADSATEQALPTTLKQYLRYAFKLTGDPDNPTPFGDPDPLPTARTIADDRVQNPTDSAFEAAVRGAAAQFRSSPFFKQDPSLEYDQVLNQAFRDDTTLYSADGKTPTDNDSSEKLQQIQETQQAHHLQGIVVHDLVADLRQYAGVADGTTAALDPATSIAFQMGLVFRFKGEAPTWLQDNDGTLPQIWQRSGPSSPSPDRTKPAKHLRTFNITKTAKNPLSTDFSENPPQFQQVQQFTDANTIAITWDLTWEQARPDGCSPCQAEPEHHLLHYQVRRRALDGSEREVVYTVKTAQVLHRATEDGSSILKRLKPRFQIVDHFNQETLDDLATLPASGKSYLYTITPIDFTSKPGRPLTLVATRYPNEPPQVPVDGELVVRYRLASTDLAADERSLSPTNSASATPSPQLVKPDRIHVEWSEPIPLKEGPKVAIAQYLLVFRKESTLPIGNYGLDSSTQRPRAKALPTTNARQLPTDIAIELEPTGPRKGRSAVISLATLQRAGVFPGGEQPEWHPEAWRVFFQTVSENGVPSAMAPVQLLLRVEAQPQEAVAAEAVLNQREERRPAELEWLPRPLQLPLLPPEDQQAIANTAHFPMPRLLKRYVFTDQSLATLQASIPRPVLNALEARKHQELTDSELTQLLATANAGTSAVEYQSVIQAAMQTVEHAPEFTGGLESIGYQPHPAGIRCVRFRWNQGPSNQPDYPLDLNASYRILELDIDAHTSETFNDPVRLGQALRLLQEVQMLPADDRLLEPNNTLTTNQWEAWYPSTLLRRKAPSDRAAGSQLSLGPWYSWRESLLVFPDWAGLTDAGQRNTSFHPFLQEILAVLDQELTLDVQVIPPMQAADFATFLKTTPTKTDPYGWNILQRLGLSVTFALYAQTGDLIHGQESLNLLQSVLDTLAQDTRWKPFYRHLHVELLFQSSQSVSLDAATTIAPTALLGIVQLSLRPVVQPYLSYAKLTIAGPANATVDLAITLKPGSACSLINQADPASGQVELSPGPQPVTVPITLPLNGQATLLLRSVNLPDAGDMRVVLRSGQKLSDFTITPLQSFSATDERSTYFTVPPTLANDFSDDQQRLGHEWRKFKRYAEALSSSDPNAPKLQLPDGKDAIAAILPEFLTWSQRFFDASGEVTSSAATEGPWLVTAYPRAGSPAYATPDANGRLTYDHLLEDKWAHNYRFYIQPTGRYDLLWRSLRQSPLLVPRKIEPAVEVAVEVLPDPQAGGLDLVLDRTQPIAPPLILNSARLDPRSQPGQPAAPGTTWEVIVAQHPEQTLIERNQTLARQLAFRQIAFTLLRRFAFPEWTVRLENEVRRFNHPSQLQLAFVENQMPALPSAYPEYPDHIDLSTTLSDPVARSLDLPQRLGAFQQGALVLQWEALPFFYEHRLLLIAQTNSQVSSINEVVQRDFEYISPPADAIVETVQTTWKPAAPFNPADPALSLRLRQIQVPLQRLWDSLPDRAQRQWAWEAPDPKDSTNAAPRKLSSLPDLDVVYQVIELFSGNIEVQAEFFFDSTSDSISKPPQYARRQLGQRILAEIVDLAPPAATTPHADYTLSATLQQVTEEMLQRSYERSLIPEPTRYKVAFKDRRITIAGILTRSDRNHILLGSVSDSQQRQALQTLLATTVPTDASLGSIFPNPQDRAHFLQDFQTLDSLYQGWFSQEVISRPLALNALPAAGAELANLVDFPEPDNCTLVWLGSLSDAERVELEAIDADDRFQQSLQRLAEAAADAPDGAWTVEAAVLGLDQVPPLFQEPVRLPNGQSVPPIAFSISDAPTRRYTGLTWTSVLLDSQVQALQRWAQLPEFIAAVTTLIDRLDQHTIVQSMPAPRPLQEELPDSIRTRLQIGETHLDWKSPAPSDVERTALNGLTGDNDFLDAVRRLLAAIDADRSVWLDPEPPHRPQQTALPDSLRNQLQLAPTQLTWTPEPNSNSDGSRSDRQLTALRALPGDPAFLTAINQLISRIQANQPRLDADPDNAAFRQALSVTLAAEAPPRPQPASLPESIRDRLQTRSNQLIWIGPAPTDTQRADLRALTADPAFVDARNRLLQAIDADQRVDLVPRPKRPRQADLPALLNSQLSLQPTAQPTQVTWRGRLHTPEHLQALQSLTGDEPFNAAIQAIVTELQTQQITVPFDLAVRPQPEDLPVTLRHKLLIGRSRIRFHGLMTIAEAQLLQARCLQTDGQTPLTPDQQAIRRLYDAALNQGLRGHALAIGTRRGSAAPRRSALQSKTL